MQSFTLPPDAAGMLDPTGKLYLDPNQMAKLYLYSLSQLKLMKEKNDNLETELIFTRYTFLLTSLSLVGR